MSLWYAICDALPLEMLHWDFMKNALLALLLMAPLFGILSTMIVTGRMSFFSDALGHSGFTGIAIGVLICFLGGLMAVDIVPRKATGAALGVVGMTSYIAAGIQDVASGWLIDSNITVAADGVKHYDFGPVAIFWLAAAVISFLLPLLNRGKVKEF